MLVYPQCEEANLPRFCAWLDRSGSAGAYGMAMSSNYNTRPRAADSALAPPPGSVVVATIEGARPLLVEVQAVAAL